VPKIPFYTAGNLASEKTGVGSVDKSGAIISEAVVGLGEKVYSLAADMYQKQDAALKQAQLAKAISSYDAAVFEKQVEIKQQYAADPDKAILLLEGEKEVLRGVYGDEFKDPESKIKFDSLAVQTNNKAKALDFAWAVQEKSMLIQKTVLEEVNSNARRLAAGGTLDTLFSLAFVRGEQEDDMKQARRASRYSGWMSAAKAEAIIDTENQSYFNAYFTGMAERGQWYEAIEQLDDPRLASMGIKPEQIAKTKTGLQTAAAAGQKTEAFSVLNRFVAGNAELADATLRGDISLSDLTERTNRLSYQVGQARQSVKDGRMDPEALATMERQLLVENALLKSRMDKDGAFFERDEATEGELAAEFSRIFKQGKGKSATIAKTLADAHMFQEKLIQNQAKVDPKAFQTWMRVTEQAFALEGSGMSPKNTFGMQKSWFGVGGPELKNKNRLSAVPKLNEVLGRLSAQTAKDQKWVEKRKGVPNAAQEYTMDMQRFFFDEIEKLNPNILSDAQVWKDIQKPAIDKAYLSAVEKAKLKAMGLPVNLQINDPVTINGMSFYKAHPDADGNPMLSDVPVKDGN